MLFGQSVSGSWGFGCYTNKHPNSRQNALHFRVYALSLKICYAFCVADVLHRYTRFQWVLRGFFLQTQIKQPRFKVKAQFKKEDVVFI